MDFPLQLSTTVPRLEGMAKSSEEMWHRPEEWKAGLKASCDFSFFFCIFSKAICLSSQRLACLFGRRAWAKGGAMMVNKKAPAMVIAAHFNQGILIFEDQKPIMHALQLDLGLLLK